MFFVVVVVVLNIMVSMQFTSPFLCICCCVLFYLGSFFCAFGQGDKETALKAVLAGDAVERSRELARWHAQVCVYLEKNCVYVFCSCFVVVAVACSCG